MFTKKTTLIIPTKDRSSKIIKLLKKIINLKINFNEIIVVDSSNQKHKNNITKFLKTKKIKFISTYPSTTHQRNIGLKRRRKDSEFILFLDDDIRISIKSFKEMNNAIIKYKNQIYAIMCFAFTNEIPKTVKELDNLSKDAFLQSALRDQKVGKIAIAYTVWSKKKGGGKLIVKEVFNMIKKSNHLNRLVTLSPLTEMATKFHLRNKAKLISVNRETQNFEYLK